MAGKVERTDAVGSHLILIQAGEPIVAEPATGAIVPLPPAHIMTQAGPNVGPALQPSSGGGRIDATVGARAGGQKVQGVLRGLEGEPLNAVGVTSGAGPTADTVRRYFFSRRDAVANAFMRDHNLTRAEAEAAADEWVARNVARWQYQRREQRSDGLRALTIAGMLIAIANAGGDVDPRLLEAAIAMRDRVRQDLIDAAAPGEGGMTPEQVDTYLRRLGASINTTTAGWGEEVRALREADYYRSYNPPSQNQLSEAVPFNPPHYTAPKHAALPLVTEPAHAEAMRRAERAASAEYAVQVEQKRSDDLRAHLANLEAEGRPVGGPTFG